MSYSEKAYGGVWKTCPECNTLYFIPDVGHWAYKKSISKGTMQRTVYFDQYHCFRAFSKRYEEEKAKKKKESAKRGHETRKKKVKV